VGGLRLQWRGVCRFRIQPPGLKRIPYYIHKDNHLKLRLRSSKKFNTTHTHTQTRVLPANFLIGALFYISVVTCNEKTWNWCAFGSHARQSRTRSLRLRNDWGGVGVWGGRGDGDFLLSRYSWCISVLL
jgi:hypothetical protein